MKKFLIKKNLVCGNLNKICIQLLCENYLNLNYVDWLMVLFQSTISFYFSVYSISFWEFNIETPIKNLNLLT